MTNTKTKKRKQKVIERGLRLLWESLESHMDSYNDFDIKCIKEYAELIYILAVLVDKKK